MKQEILVAIIALSLAILACNAPLTSQADVNPVDETVEATRPIGQPPTLAPIRIEGTDASDNIDFGVVSEENETPAPEGAVRTPAATLIITIDREPTESPAQLTQEAFALPPTSTLDPNVSGTLNPPTPTPEGLINFSYEINWVISEEDDMVVIATVEVTATGGDDTYRYYWNDREKEGPEFEIEAEVCQNMIASLRVSSGDGQRKNKAVISETPCPGSIGS
ncbi:MAG: hypothetical protein AAF633_10715 [Chloroflexota bacterium]